MHRLAHWFVAAERERQAGDAAEMGVRQGSADPARRLDEVDAVIVVLLEAGRDREDVRIEDDVLGREVEPLDQDVIGALADLGLARVGVGLSGLIERHHHHGRAVAFGDRRLMQELLLALLERDRVHDRLALDALQTGLDDVEFEESTITSTRAMSGSEATRLRNSTIAFSESSSPSSMLTSITWAPFSPGRAPPEAPRCSHPR